MKYCICLFSLILILTSCKSETGSNDTSSTATQIVQLSLAQKVYVLYTDTDMIMDKLINGNYTGNTTSDLSIFNCENGGTIEISGFDNFANSKEQKIEFKSCRYINKVSFAGNIKKINTCDNLQNIEITVNGTITYKYGTDSQTGKTYNLVTDHQDFSGALNDSCDMSLKITSNSQGSSTLEGTVCGNDVKDVNDTNYNAVVWCSIYN